MEHKRVIIGLKESGLSQVEIAEILHSTCNGNLEAALADLHEIFNSNKDFKVSVEVRSWVEQQDGWFDVAALDKDLSIISPQHKATRRKAIQRLKEEGIIEADKERAGRYRFISKDFDVLDWWNADTSNKFDFEWAFPIHDLCYLLPGNIVVIAGSGDAGKTCLSLDFVQRNMHKHPVIYLTSEMTREELDGRFDQFESRGIAMKDDWRAVEFRCRSTNFADLVEPGCINVIDYLEMSDNFFLVGQYIREIFEKLNGTGLAIVNIQKKANAEYGRGGELTMEKARLYIALDYNKLTIRKGKNRVNPAVNPAGRMWTFSGIWGGCEFMNIQESQDEHRD